MTNIIYPRQFHSRITSASKPSAGVSIEQNAINVMWSERLAIRDITNEQLDTVCARVKRETLLNSGWSVYDGETVVVYTHPEVSNNEPFFLDDAYGLQMEIVHGRRYWK